MSFESYKYAIKGIKKAFISEKNFRFMLICFMAVVFLGIFFKLSRIEWCIILLCCGGMLASEIFNTAIESTINLCTLEYHPMAEKAKDMAAGAVLVFAFFSAMIGLIIFIPHIFQLLN